MLITYELFKDKCFISYILTTLLYILDLSDIWIGQDMDLSRLKFCR